MQGRWGGIFDNSRPIDTAHGSVGSLLRIVALCALLGSLADTVGDNRNQSISRCLQALNTSDMSLKRPETRPRSNIPQLHRRIVTGGHQQVLLVDLNLVDQITVAFQSRTLARRKVPDLDSGVGGSRSEDTRVEIESDHTIGMSLKCADALTRVVVPDLKSTIHRSCNQLGLVKMECAHTKSVSREGTETLACLNVPDLGSVIVRAGDQERVVKLKTHHAVGVAPEGLQSVVALSPVSLYNQTL